MLEQLKQAAFTAIQNGNLTELRLLLGATNTSPDNPSAYQHRTQYTIHWLETAAEDGPPTQPIKPKLSAQLTALTTLKKVIDDFLVALGQNPTLNTDDFLQQLSQAKATLIENKHSARRFHHNLCLARWESTTLSIFAAFDAPRINGEAMNLVSTLNALSDSMQSEISSAKMI